MSFPGQVGEHPDEYSCVSQQAEYRNQPGMLTTDKGPNGKTRTRSQGQQKSKQGNAKPAITEIIFSWGKEKYCQTGDGQGQEQADETEPSKEWSIRLYGGCWFHFAKK